MAAMKEYAAGIQTSDLRLVDLPAPVSEESEGDDAGLEIVVSAPAAAPAKPGAGVANAARPFAPPSGSADALALAPVETAVGATLDSPQRGPADVLGDSLAAPDTVVEVSETDAGDGSPASAPGAVDKFMTAATKEFEAGILDQPLWKRAVAQTAGDRTAATQAYLRARATALRVSKREKRQERQARRERAVSELSQPADGRAGAARGAAPSLRKGPRRKQVMWIGGALASLFVVALLVTVRSETGAAQQGAAQQIAVEQASAAKPQASAVGSVEAANDSSAAASPVPPQAAAAKPIEPIASENLAAKVQALRASANWNMVVLYAVEWARKQPENPDPWRALTEGYMKLHQYREALDAATRVTQISSEDALAWRNLGEINVALQQPVDAMAAFQEALARNDQDTASIVQIGLINTQLGRLPDARAAFDKALAQNARNVDALCGSQTVAQKEGRGKDAEELAHQISALDGRCRDANPGQSVRVAVGAKKTSPTSR
ncbi:MAG TPA: hypothetical protein VMN79_20585 [Casimicrobiaceae bacterium]|nr:hypothetical protein [Casimicrobiaceae bacterium]